MDYTVPIALPESYKISQRINSLYILWKFVRKEVVGVTLADNSKILLDCPFSILLTRQDRLLQTPQTTGLD